jgi:hypothetical protein
VLVPVPRDEVADPLELERLPRRVVEHRGLLLTEADPVLRARGRSGDQGGQQRSDQG